MCFEGGECINIYIFSLILKVRGYALIAASTKCAEVRLESGDGSRFGSGPAEVGPESDSRTAWVPEGISLSSNTQSISSTITEIAYQLAKCYKEFFNCTRRNHQKSQNEHRSSSG